MSEKYKENDKVRSELTAYLKELVKNKNTIRIKYIKQAVHKFIYKKVFKDIKKEDRKKIDKYIWKFFKLTTDWMLAYGYIFTETLIFTKESEDQEIYNIYENKLSEIRGEFINFLKKKFKKRSDYKKANDSEIRKLVYAFIFEKVVGKGKEIKVKKKPIADFYISLVDFCLSFGKTLTDTLFNFEKELNDSEIDA